MQDSQPPKPKYCSRIPLYPKSAFMVYFRLSDDTSKFHYPVTQLFTSLTQMRDEAKVLSEIITQRNTLEVDPTAVILPVVLDELFPLKEEYWKSPHVHYDYYQRMDLFLRVLNLPSFFRILVTPIHEKNREIFVSACPFYAHTGNKLVEKFMLYSDFPVDETAKFAALYRTMKPKEIDWQTNKFL